MNLFSGRNGQSDGTADGYSSSIPPGNRTISVHGEFGGANVSIMRYSEENNLWFATQAVWKSPDVFQGLEVTESHQYRLQINGATGTTNITAEV